MKKNIKLRKILAAITLPAMATAAVPFALTSCKSAVPVEMKITTENVGYTHTGAEAIITSEIKIVDKNGKTDGIDQSFEISPISYTWNTKKLNYVPKDDTAKTDLFAIQPNLDDNKLRIVVSKETIQNDVEGHWHLEMTVKSTAYSMSIPLAIDFSITNNNIKILHGIAYNYDKGLNGWVISGVINLQDFLATPDFASQINTEPVKAIGSAAFHGVEFTKTIGEQTTYIPLDLSHITTLVKIDSHAFDGAIFGNVTLPAGLTTIADYAFNNAGTLNGSFSMNIPNSVTTIGDYAFAASKFDLNIDNKNNTIQTIGSHAFALSVYAEGNKEEIRFPQVITIGDHAFFLSSIKKITLDKVVEIGDYAFAIVLVGSGVQEVTTGNTLKKIGLYAFRANDKLATFNFGGTKAEWEGGLDWENNGAVEQFKGAFKGCDALKHIICNVTESSIHIRNLTNE